MGSIHLQLELDSGASPHAGRFMWQLTGCSGCQQAARQQPNGEYLHGLFFSPCQRSACK